MKTLFLAVFVWISFAAFAEVEECHEPQEHCQALALYSQAVTKHQTGDYKTAASLAHQARQLVDVSGELSYNILCLSLQDLGYVSDLVFVPCERVAPYNPQGLIKQIKQEHPPLPFVFVTTSGQKSPWTALQKHLGQGQAKKIIIGNDGQSAMTDIELMVSEQGKSLIETSVESVDVSGRWKTSLATDVSATSLTIKLKEKDGYGFD